MSTKTKTVLVDEVILAIKKNGYLWNKGSAFAPATEASCVLGQAVRNLIPELDEIEDKGVKAFRIADTMWKLSHALDRVATKLGSYIWRFNDKPDTKSYEQAAEYAIAKLRPYKGRKIIITYTTG